MQISFERARIPQSLSLSHIKFRTETGLKDRRGLTFGYDNNDTYRRIFVPPSSQAPTQSIHLGVRDCFAVLISKMVNALEVAAKNEGETRRESPVAF